MKKSMRILPFFLAVFSIIMVLWCPENAFADQTGSCGDGLVWNLSEEGVLQITGSGNVTGSSWDEGSIVRVLIPEGVTSIDEGLFLHCKNFLGYEVAASNKNLSSKDGVLFNKEKTALIDYPSGLSGGYTIPETVNTIRTGAFALCEKLTSVKMPKSVTSLGSFSFNCCSGLTSVEISASVKVIPGDCFSNCSSLTSVKIPDGVTRIEASAFWGCSSLSSVSLPDSLKAKSIALDAFEGCPLGKDSEKAVNEKLDSDDPDIIGTDLEVGEEKDYQLSPTINGSSIENSFYAYSSDESVVKVTSLTRNGSIVYANAVKYFYVLGVKAVGPGEAVVSVYGDSYKIKLLSETQFKVTGEAPDTPDKTDTEKETFATGFKLAAGEKKECKGESTISGSLIESAFFAESSDKSIVEIISIARGGNVNYTNGITYLYTVEVKGVKPGKAVVTVYADKTKEKEIGATIITVTGDASGSAEEETPAGKTVRTVTKGGGIYKLSKSSAVLSKPKNKNVTKITIPESVSANGKKYKVTSIAENACKGCTKLTTLTVGKNVKTIGAKAFAGCTSLKTVKGCKGVTTIGTSAFSGDKKLTTVELGSKLTTIGDKAFYNCAALKKVTIPAKVAKIGKSAFQGCKKLSTITIKSAKLTSKKVGANAFKGTPAKATVKVPKKQKTAYKKWLFAKGINKKAKIQS